MEVENDSNLEEKFDSSQDDEEVTYGYLITLGNSQYQGMKGKRTKPLGEPNTIYTLKKRKTPNGLRILDERTLTLGKGETEIPNGSLSIGATRSITLHLSHTERGLIEYQDDELTDLFQFGRASLKNDHIITGYLLNGGSTMSRYAFRIVCDRQVPYRSRIFAGGFDADDKLYLGPSALTWGYKRDGLVTNGVRICKNVYEEEPEWKEVSCRGNLYNLRTKFTSRGVQDENADNILSDYTLINVGGITLMWVSNLEMKKSFRVSRMDVISELDKLHVVCPVNLGTIVFGSILDSTKTEAYVYPKCGHVHGFSQSLVTMERCTICRTEGKYTELKIASEHLLKVFCKDTPDHVYNPCGHATDAESAKIWSELPQPDVEDGVYVLPKTNYCPFCRTELDGDKPFSKLIYQMDK